MRNIGKILITLWVCAMLGLVTGMFFSSRIQFAGNGIKYDLGDDFYQVGEIFEFSDSQVAGAKDITKQGRIRWTFRNPFYGKTSSYLLFFIEGQAVNGHAVTVRIQDVNKEDITQIVQTAGEGWNIAPFSVQEAKRFRIVLDIGDDCGVAITAVKVLERKPVGYEMLMIAASISFCIYVVGYALYSSWKKKHNLESVGQLWIELLQKVYVRFGECGMGWKRSLGQFWSGVLRQILWIFLFGCCFITEINGSYLKIEAHRNLLVAGSLLLILIGMLYAEKEIRLCPWDDILSKCYFAFAVCLTLSDFMIHKKAGGEGMVLLFIIPFVIFMWQNMEKPKELFYDVLIAVIVIGVIIMLDRVMFGMETNSVATIFWSDLATNADRKRVLKQFIWTMSPWGHDGALTCFGEKQAIYSGALGVLYRYGVFAFIPYVVMIVCYLVKLIRNIPTKWYVSTGGMILLIISVVTDFELVFGSWCWVLFYLCMGYFFQTDRGKNKNASFGSGR
ncbi:hypothetical protein [Roseburia intestinalis]|uniref:hypothetical protein n=1 Tax=Roseburia intestinalis TaxID=166486 RepID=UPI0035222AD6